MKVITNNLLFNADQIDVQQLKKRFELHTITIPDSFRHKRKNMSTTQSNALFAQLHNAFKEQLDCPYYFHSFSATIYILRDLAEHCYEPDSIDLEFLNPSIVPAYKANIEDLLKPMYWHVFLKLLFAHYFYNANRNYRIHQGHFYLKSIATKKSLLAMKVELKSYRRSDGKAHEFSIYPSVERFYPKKREEVIEKYIPSNSFFELTQGATLHLRQLKSRFITKWKEGKEGKHLSEVWQPQFKKSRNNRPHIDWFHDRKNPKKCRSYLLNKLHQDFINHCQNCVGKKAVMPQERRVGKLNIPKKEMAAYHLPVEYLKKVGLLDLRFKEVQPDPIPFSRYLELCRQLLPKELKIELIEIDRTALPSTNLPILVLQDVDKDAFYVDKSKEEQSGLFVREGYQDPKEELYQEFTTKIPLQTIGINPNNSKDYHAIRQFLDYEFPEGKERKNLQQKLEVCLKELLLKKCIVEQLPVKPSFNKKYKGWAGLPLLKEHKTLRQLAFMHKQAFLYVNEQGQWGCLDLRKPAQKKQRTDWLKSNGVSWKEIRKEFAQRNYTLDQEGGDKKRKHRDGKLLNLTDERIASTRFIFGPQLALAIEDTEERAFPTLDPEKLDKLGSQRGRKQINTLIDVNFSIEEKLYAIGSSQGIQEARNSVKFRRIHPYQHNTSFDLNLLIQTMGVQFVRHKQYAVYPYPFHILKLWKEVYGWE